MKTTVEIPDELFRQAKIQAAMQGIPLRELFIQGLQLVMQKSSSVDEQRRTQFPIIIGTPRAEPLTNEQVAEALEQMAQEEIIHDASFV
jgi:hypothetical protein